MKEYAECEYEGKIYIHDGSGWFDKTSMLRVPDTLAAKLDEKCGEVNWSLQRLRGAAAQARADGQYALAERLILRVVRQTTPPQPFDVVGHEAYKSDVALYSSVLQLQEKYEDIVDKVPVVDFAPVLTSRAAALYKLGRHTEARSTVKRALALNPGDKVARELAERFGKG